MTILHISSTRSWRGGEQQLLYLIDELETKGVRQHVVCRNGSALAERVGNPSGLPFRNALDPITAVGLARLCSGGEFDLMHAHTGRAHDAALVASLLGCRTPIVLSRRVIFPIAHTRLSRWKYNHRQIGKIIAVSHEIARQLQEVVDDPDRLTTIHDGVDPGRFGRPTGGLHRRFGLPSGAPLVGIVGALSGEKDHRTFVETAELVAAEDSRTFFLIIGSGPEEEAIRELVRTKGLVDRVILTGFIEEIDEVLPELTLLLSTSRHEGLGSSILDAFAARVAVVATETGGVPEIVEDGVTGLLAPVGDARSLAAAVIRLLTSPDHAADLTRAAAIRLDADFTAEAMAEATLRVYEEVADRR